MVHGRTLSIITDEVILTNLIANSWNFWNDSFKKTTKQDRSVMTSYALLLTFQRSNDRIWLMHAKQFRVKIANKEMYTHAANSCCFLGSCTCKLLQLHIYSKWILRRINVLNLSDGKWCEWLCELDHTVLLHPRVKEKFGLKGFIILLSCWFLYRFVASLFAHSSITNVVWQ